MFDYETIIQKGGFDDKSNQSSLTKVLTDINGNRKGLDQRESTSPMNLKLSPNNKPSTTRNAPKKGGFRINPLPTLQEESPQTPSPEINVDKVDTSEFEVTPHEVTDIEIHEFNEMSKIEAGSFVESPDDKYPESRRYSDVRS